MTSAMMSVLRMPAQLHSPSAPSTAAATISTPPRPRAALWDGAGRQGGEWLGSKGGGGWKQACVQADSNNFGGPAETAC